MKNQFRDDILVDAGINIIDKKIKIGILSVTASAITLTNHEIKDIIKLIKSLEIRGISLKEIARKITSHQGRFLNFLVPSMIVGL